MRKYISRLLGSFPDLRCGLRISRSYTPTTEFRADEDTNLDVEGVTTTLAADETRLDNPSAVRRAFFAFDLDGSDDFPQSVRLDHLSNFRIGVDAIDFTSTQPHASGGKAQVVKATLKRSDEVEEQQVAVKKLQYHNGIDKQKFCNEFVHEVDVMARLSHDNVVKLIGFVEDLKEGTAWIVLCWAPNGNVSEFLATRECEIPERMSLIQDTFAGIEYLHTRQPPICHGDLKSLNILVSASYRAIITDFGSARILGETEDRQERRDKDATVASVVESASNSQITLVASSDQLTLTGPAWSLRWAAPEVAMGERQNLASDIWAAGWICWEIMTNRVPFPEFNAQGVITLKVMQGEVPSAREDAQLSQITRLCSLMEDCWRFNPKKRPDVARCTNEVKRMPSIPPLGGKASDSKKSSPEILYQMGRLHSGQGNLQEAILLFQQVLARASPGDQDASARASFELGRANYLMSRYPEAEQYLTRAQDLFARIGDESGRANADIMLAKMYRAQSKLTQAEECYTQARDISSRIGNDKDLGSALLGLGNISHDRSNYPVAEEFYNQALDLYNRLGDSRGQANTLRGLGKLRQDSSEYTAAEESFKQAQEIFSRIGDNVGRAHATLSLGQLCQVQGLDAKAMPLFVEAKSIYVQVGDSKMENYCSRLLDRMSDQGESSATSPLLSGIATVSSPSQQE